jgi:hypothetical protein
MNGGTMIRYETSLGKDEAVPIGEPHCGPLLDRSLLRWSIARQGSTEAYGGYDELFHGFWEVTN